MLNNRTKLILMYITVGVLGRIIPHPVNVTPFTNISLFAGTNLPRKIAIPLVVFILLLSNLALSFIYSYPLFGYWSLFTYTGFVTITFASSKLVKTATLKSLLFFVSVASISFWLWTNFGEWIFNPMYTKNFNGFLTCYSMALPFLRNSLLGDIAWLSVIKFIERPTYVFQCIRFLLYNGAN